MKTWEQVPGWFDYSETYDKIINSQLGGIVVEVGCYLGRSLCYLGKKVKDSSKSFKVVGVDHCLGSGVENGRDNHVEAVQEGGGNFAGILLNNIIECGLQDTISLLIVNSTIAASLFPDNSITCVFLDAGHSYEEVKQNITEWLPKIKIGGILAGDDVGVPNEVSPIWPGVKQACNELLPGWLHSPHDAFIWTKR